MPVMLQQLAQPVAYFYSATLAWHVSAVDRLARAGAACSGGCDELIAARILSERFRQR